MRPYPTISRLVALTVLIGAVAAGCAGAGSRSAVPGGTAPDEHQRAVRSLASLGAYNVDKTKTAVAGISSGGFMAVQLHVAFSGTFHFAAVYAGGPYYCAQDSLSTAQTVCQYATSSSLAVSPTASSAWPAAELYSTARPPSCPTRC